MFQEVSRAPRLIFGVRVPQYYTFSILVDDILIESFQVFHTLALNIWGKSDIGVCLTRTESGVCD